MKCGHNKWLITNLLIRDYIKMAFNVWTKTCPQSKVIIKSLAWTNSRLWPDFLAFRLRIWLILWQRAGCLPEVTSSPSPTAWARAGSQSTRSPWASTRGCSTTSSAASTSCSPSADSSTERVRPLESWTSSDSNVSLEETLLNRFDTLDLACQTGGPVEGLFISVMFFVTIICLWWRFCDYKLTES